VPEFAASCSAWASGIPEEVTHLPIVEAWKVTSGKLLWWPDGSLLWWWLRCTVELLLLLLLRVLLLLELSRLKLSKIKRLNQN
jgi:hypothetical protein